MQIHILEDAMESSTQEIIEYLSSNGIPHIRFSHPVVFTMEEKLKNDLDAGVTGATHCKNLLLCNRQGTLFYLLIMPYEKSFRTAEVSKQLGVSRLSFASEEKLSSFLHTHSGAVSPLGLMYDTEFRVGLAIDKELENKEKLCFHPNDESMTCIFENHVFYQTLLPLLKHRPRFIKVEEIPQSKQE